MIKTNHDRRMVCTFINAGTAFQFDAEYRASKHKNGPTMLQIHARMTLDAMKTGRKDVFIIDSGGAQISHYDLRRHARNTAAQDNRPNFKRRT